LAAAPGGGAEPEEEKKRDPGETVRTPQGETNSLGVGVPRKEICPVSHRISKDLNRTADRKASDTGGCSNPRMLKWKIPCSGWLGRP
jgi:hypothetical protein